MDTRMNIVDAVLNDSANESNDQLQRLLYENCPPVDPPVATESLIPSVSIKNGWDSDSAQKA